MEITSRTFFDGNIPSSIDRFPLTIDITHPNAISVLPTNTVPPLPLDYGLVQPWTLIDFDQFRQPRGNPDGVVADGESSDSSFEGDSPVTIMARELRRKKREFIEMQSLPQTNFRHAHERARDLRIEIAELELLVSEERILESLREERETLIHVLNSVVRSGIRRDVESRVLLQERIEALNQKCDTINVERSRRGALETRQFPLCGSTRELILIRNHDASDLAPYDGFQGSQTEDGSADDYEFDFDNEPQGIFGDNPKDDYEGESDASSPDSGVFLPSNDGHGQYPYDRMRYCEGVG